MRSARPPARGGARNGLPPAPGPCSIAPVLSRPSAALAALTLLACHAPPGPAPPAPAAPALAAPASAAPGLVPSAPAAPCALPGEPVVVKQEGEARIERWDLDDGPLWSSEALPAAPGFAAYRAAIRDAGNDRLRPVSERAPPASEREREAMRRDDANAALVFDGGLVRPIRCLEAALFARQDARYSELTHPTEHIVSILRRGGRLRVYVGGSDRLFSRGAFYGIDQARADVAEGWTYHAVLHNHTVVTYRGKPALGTPAPSTNDVQLMRALVEEAGLREVWVTNGFYTGVVPAAALARFHGPPEAP